MKKIGIINCLMACVALLSIQSCGSTDTGGAALFNTVTATAAVNSASNPLLSDLAKWTGSPCAIGSTYSTINNVINFSITTTSNISNGTLSPLMLQRATITFTPADTLTPALSLLYSPVYQNLVGYVVPAGGSLTIPIEVVTHSLKESFQPTLVCTGNASIYNYNATVTFDAVERETGKSGQISAGMTVRFTDFAD